MMEWQELLHADLLFRLLRATLFILAGLVVARLVPGVVIRGISKKLDSHQSLIIGKVLRYAILALFFISALNELGFSLSVLLGAAGILTVAIGFASQTSASNLISGLFLLGERPFSVGDVIKVGGTTGEVIAIDLLSVKMRTFENLYVRIPNESILKTEVTTLTRFPIRRMEISIGIAYKEDLRRVKEILLAVADANPDCLDEPSAICIITGFGNSSIDILFCVWARREAFLDARNSLYEEIKEAFDRNGIEIPYPHISLYAGEATAAFPVRLDSKQT